MTSRKHWWSSQVMVACFTCLLCVFKSGVTSRWTLQHAYRDLIPVATTATFATPTFAARNLFSPITDQEFDQCIDQLEIVAGTDRRVGMEEFILFLELYSGRSLAFEDFQDLPTPLILIFFTAACSFGDGCDSENETSFSLDNLQNSGALGVLYTFCQSVKDVNAIQLVVGFEFQIRHIGVESSLSETISSSDGASVIVALQQIIERVLLERFGCISRSQRVLGETWKAELEEAKRDKARQDIFSLRGLDPHSEQSDGAGHKRSTLSGLPCDYKVHANIKAITPTVCLPDALDAFDFQNLEKCALVSADVSVSAASLHHHFTIAALRGDVVGVLNEAFTKNVMQRLFG